MRNKKKRNDGKPKTPVISPQNNKSKQSTMINFEKNLERWSGRSISSLRNDSIEEIRESLRLKGIFIKLFSEFPFIGRGNVLRDKVLSHEEVEKELSEALH